MQQTLVLKGKKIEFDYLMNLQWKDKNCMSKHLVHSVVMVKELCNVVGRGPEKSLFLQVEDALARFLVEADDINVVVVIRRLWLWFELMTIAIIVATTFNNKYFIWSFDEIFLIKF